MQVNVQLAPKLEQVFVGPARYRVMEGGRGSSKSWGAASMLIIKALENPGAPILCARELQNSIKDSVHKLLSDTIHRMGLNSLFDIGESFLRCKNGAYFIFKGLRTNAQEIKSLEGVKYCWVEEAQKVSKNSLELLIPTIRAPGSEIWFTLNADEAEDAVYSLFIAGTPPPNSRVVKINWNDNPWFPAELEEERRYMEINDPDAYDHVWNGNCKKFAGGAIYGKLMVAMKEGDPATGQPKRICAVPYNPAFPVITAWDIGYADTLSIGFLQIVGKEPRMIDYYENHLEAIDHYVKVIKDKPYIYEAHALPHDAGHKSLRTGTTLAKQITDMGLKDATVLPVDSIESGIALVRALLPQIWMDETKCALLIKALLAYQYEYDEERGTFKDRPLHDWASHPSDMMRYMATFIARRKKPALAQPQKVTYSINQASNWMG